MKMVICDVDGTLLKKSEDKVPKKTIEYIRLLSEKENIVVIASGRCYSDLIHLFGNISDKIIFVCLDGTFIVKNDALIREEYIPKNYISSMFKRQENIVFYGKRILYYKSNNERFISEIRHAVRNHAVEVESIDEIDEKILKIAIYKNMQKGKNINGLKKIYENDDWTEYVKSGINKGTAITLLQQKFKVLQSDTFAFGDGKNDIEMFKRAGNRYTTKNAHKDLKKISNNITDTIENSLYELLEK